MATEQEFVNFKDFVNNLPEATDFAPADKSVVSNGTDGPRNMSKTTAEKLVAQRTLADNVAVEFVAGVTSAKANRLYVYQGALYKAKANYSGVWDSSKFLKIDVETILVGLNKFLGAGFKVFYGRFQNGETIFSSSDIPAGTTVSYNCTANGTTGYLKFYKTDSTAVNKGKTSGSAAADFSGSYILPSNFDHCEIYASSSSTVDVWFVAPSASLELMSVEPKQDKINKQLGNLVSGSFSTGKTLFTSNDVMPGSRIRLKFHVNSPSIGYLKFFKTDGTSKNYGKVNSDPVFNFDDVVTLPNDFDHCETYSNSDYTLDVEYIICYKFRDVDGDYQELPHYYPGYLAQKCDVINSCMDASVAHGDAFVFITDEHWEDNSKKSPLMLKYIYEHTSVNKMFSGGDIYDGNHDYDYPNARDFMLMMKRMWPGTIYPCVGNHDMFKHMPTSRIAALYDMYHDDYNGDPENHYYYVDNKRAKIRYIVLSDYYESETDNDVNGFTADTVQQQWFLNDALNLPAGWGAVIFTHQCYYNSTDVVTDLTLDTRFRDTLISFVNSYSGAGEIIAIIQGHTHCDRVFYSKPNNDGVPIIITTCDKNRAITINGEPDIYPSDRASGTTREQAFDVFVIDRDNRKINIVRCGCEAYDGVGDEIGDAVEVREVYY